MKLLSFISMLLVLTGFHFQVNSMTKKKHDSANIKSVFEPMINDRWIGIGISYGSYRDGESPGKKSVSSEKDILQDMLLLTADNDVSWNLIRMYAADAASEQVLKTIKKHNLPVKVMQGAWLSSTQTDEENQQQISDVIRLANEYKDIVVTVNLGNEIFVDWSAHKLEKSDYPKYLGWVKRVKTETEVPVTLADDYNFWNKPWSQEIAQALDYIVLHAYAMWNSQPLENALPWTEKTFFDIRALHPTKQIVLGESGWATSAITSNGDESLIIGEASEIAQKVFYDAYRQWLVDNHIVSYYFEAFDEKWKGGEDKPDGIAEKNWGVFRSDRTPKMAIKEHYSKGK
ncbi:MAG: exo-beta-1,3-glucanase (GH17 family) [Gammaproteobacteria bacterium]|jgi:exo-beta-1,3-glucanase (GH17 family)